MGTFYLRLRQERILRGITQRQLATYIDATPNSVTMYESGKREPSLETFKRICDFLDVSADYLLGRTDTY